MSAFETDTRIKDWRSPVTVKSKKRTIHEMVQENFGNTPAIDRLQERYELNKLISKLKVVASKLKN